MARNPTVVTSNPGATARREPSSHPFVASPPPPPRAPRAPRAPDAIDAASAAASDDAKDDARIIAVAPRAPRRVAHCACTRTRRDTFSPSTSHLCAWRRRWRRRRRWWAVRARAERPTVAALALGSRANRAWRTPRARGRGSTVKIHGGRNPAQRT